MNNFLRDYLNQLIFDIDEINNKIDNIIENQPINKNCEFIFLINPKYYNESSSIVEHLHDFICGDIYKLKNREMKVIYSKEVQTWGIGYINKSFIPEYINKNYF